MKDLIKEVDGVYKIQLEDGFYHVSYSSYYAAKMALKRIRSGRVVLPSRGRRGL